MHSKWLQTFTDFKLLQPKQMFFSFISYAVKYFKHFTIQTLLEFFIIWMTEEQLFCCFSYLQQFEWTSEILYSSCMFKKAHSKRVCKPVRDQTFSFPETLAHSTEFSTWQRNFRCFWALPWSVQFRWTRPQTLNDKNRHMNKTVIELEVFVTLLSSFVICKGLLGSPESALTSIRSTFLISVKADIVYSKSWHGDQIWCTDFMDMDAPLQMIPASYAWMHWWFPHPPNWHFLRFDSAPLHLRESIHIGPSLGPK